jgi:hypothetical protein
MGGFAALLPTIIPAAETIVEKVIAAIKGTAPAPAGHGALSGPLATAISNASGFGPAVKSRDQTGAANAAAAAVPGGVSDPTKTGAKAALDSTSANKAKLAAQLLAVRQLLDLCHEAHYCLFSVYFMMNKNGKLDQPDKDLMKDAWGAAAKDITAFIDQARKTIPTISPSSGAKIAFQNLLQGWDNPLYSQIGEKLKTIGDSAPAPLIANTLSLFNLVSTAAIAGAVTLEEVATGADPSQVPTPLGSNLGRHLSLMKGAD